MSFCTDAEMGMLNDLLDLEDGLSDWEVGFIESISKQFDHHEPLSSNQRQKLTEIWDKQIG